MSDAYVVVDPTEEEQRGFRWRRSLVRVSDGAVICLDGGAVLSIDAWPYDYFPIVLFLPFPRQDSCWSRPMPAAKGSTCTIAAGSW